jgi:hypothetical protein
MAANIAAAAVDELARTEPPAPPPRPKREPVPKPRGIEWSPQLRKWCVPSNLTAEQLASTTPSPETLRRLQAAYAGAPVALPLVRPVVRAHRVWKV